MYYKLCELDTCVEHELDFENIADMRCCLGVVYALKQLRIDPSPEDKERFEYIVKNIPNMECLSETIQKISKVNIPVTDY